MYHPTRVDHEYKVRDKFKLNNNDAYKYEIKHKGPFVISQCWNNSTVTLQCDETKIRYNTRHVDPHTPDIKVEHINSKK